ncbi:hypothetical protein GCK32_017817, partial [Trichostrongylus colubriformis]
WRFTKWFSAFICFMFLILLFPPYAYRCMVCCFRGQSG